MQGFFRSSRGEHVDVRARRPSLRDRSSQQVKEKGFAAWSHSRNIDAGPAAVRMPSEPWQRYLPLFPWVVGLILALWLLSDISYTVKPYEQAVVLRFGKYHATTMPGLHFKVPLVDQVMKVSVEEHGLRLPFGPAVARRGRRSSRSGITEDETLMLTGDLNTASVEWTVQWKVTEPSQFLFRFPLDDRRPVRRGPADDRGPHRDESAGGRLLVRRGDRRQAERHRVRGPRRRPADPRRLRLRHHRDGPADAAGDPARPGQAGVRQGQRLDPGEAEAGERGRGEPEQADPRGQGQPRQADPRGRGLRLPPPRRGQRRDRGAPGQVSRLSARPGDHPPAALPRGHAGRAPGREGQDDHRCRAQAVSCRS